MSCNTTIAKHEPILAGETKHCGLNLTTPMASSEVLSGTPTVTAEVVRGAGTTSHLTISGEAVNVAATEIDDETAAIGKAAIWTAALSSSGVSGTHYKLTVTCSTDAGQVLKETMILEVV